ncbi:hypothetical protein J9303_10290 [Bacillaceae bacterium Marseille-Q3522]|nr:hypothetical protein [Bacillaceae bacterium Marseille-Q3522]
MIIQLLEAPFLYLGSFHIGSFAAIDFLISDQEKPVEWSKDAIMKDIHWINACEF